MNEGMFDVDLTMIRGLEAIYRKTPKFFAKATGDMLNEFAFGTRVEAFYEIASRMTVRNPRFVSSRLQVTKSKKSLPVAGQISVMGSKATDRFSGWTEQQLGTKTTRERTISALARMGNFKRQAVPKARLKPSNQFLSYHDIRIKGNNSADRRSIVLIRMLARAKSNQPFILTHKDGFRPGLYRLKGGKVKILQRFEKEQPHRIPWLTSARTRYFKNTDIKRLWHKTFERELQYAGWRRLR
jgi:hypothetical protein